MAFYSLGVYLQKKILYVHNPNNSSLYYNANASSFMYSFSYILQCVALDSTSPPSLLVQ